MSSLPELPLPQEAPSLSTKMKFDLIQDTTKDLAMQTASIYLTNLIQTLKQQTPDRHKELSLFRVLNTFFTLQWPQVITLFSATPADPSLLHRIQESFDTLISLPAVKSFHCLKNGLFVHKCLTLLLLSSTQTQNSKGKCYKPTGKQERELKKAIRNF